MASLADALLGVAPGPIPLASLRTAQDVRNIPLASLLGVGSDVTPAASMQTMMGGNQGVGPADAYQSTSGAVGDWIADQRAQSAAQGLWNDQTGLPTAAGMKNAAMGIALGTNSSGGGIRAYHGSPHDFDAFDASKIGTGEGAQAYGHGLYFAGEEGVAREYRDTLTRLANSSPEKNVVQQELNAVIQASNAKFGELLNQGVRFGSPEAETALAPHTAAIEAARAKVSQFQNNPGHMYEVNIAANPDHFLDWDKPLSQQSQHVQEALQRTPYPPANRNESVAAYIARLETNRAYATREGDPSGLAAAALQQAGIPGIRYLDSGSRASGEGTSNHVVFSPELIQIIRKYGIAGLMAGGGAATGASGQ